MCRFCEQAAFGQEQPYDPQLGWGGFVPGANMAPDLILHGGPILTMTDALPEAQALAIRQGVIQAVGRADEVLSRRGRATRVIALDGRAVVPGFIGTGLRLPARRDRASLDRWIEGRARAGFTTVDVLTLGQDWREFDGLMQLIDKRHRLRLRGAAVGVNYPDFLIIADRCQFRPDRPFFPGCRGVGGGGHRGPGS